MSESIQTAARERLEALLGEWTMQAGTPDGPPWPGAGRLTSEWLERSPLLVQRWQVDMPEAPGLWKLWRDGEPFSQRFTGTFSEDGNTITGLWEIAEDGKTWRSDFELVYTKVR